MVAQVTDITARMLTASAFAPYGDVIGTDGSAHFSINSGTAQRFDDLSRIQITDHGAAAISIFVAQPVLLPFVVSAMEAHPLGSQAFVPMDANRFLVVVAADDNGHPAMPEVFLATGGQGINFRPGVWHHPLLALGSAGRFLVVDRVGEGANLITANYEQTNWRVTEPVMEPVTGQVRDC